MIATIVDNERLNFVLTNWIPRRALTRLVGRLAKVEQPHIRDLSIALWRQFSDVDLTDARKSHFSSLHDCFIRELKAGARTVDSRADILVSPSDGIVGSAGRIDNGVMLQVKGSNYLLSDLVGDERLVESYRRGTYVTLRLTAGMYHRFHAPHDCRVRHISHISGDTWNVNPPTLKRVPGVFCRNERAIIRLELASGDHRVTLVPVAAILVAGIKLKFANLPTDRSHRGIWSANCDATLNKGEEMGWFEHGSTIIVLAPPDFTLCDGIDEGRTIRMGQALLQLPTA